MFYLGIDQHRKQLTVNLRNEAGDVVLRRQWGKVRWPKNGPDPGLCNRPTRPAVYRSSLPWA